MRERAIDDSRPGPAMLAVRRLRTAVAAGTPCERCKVRPVARCISGTLCCSTCAPAATLDRRIAQQRQDADRLRGRR